MIDFGILGRMEVIDVAGEFHASIGLESYISWQPLVIVRVVIYFSLPRVKNLFDLFWFLGNDCAFASPVLDRILDADAFIFESSCSAIHQWVH